MCNTFLLLCLSIIKLRALVLEFVKSSDLLWDCLFPSMYICSVNFPFSRSHIIQVWKEERKRWCEWEEDEKRVKSETIKKVERIGKFLLYQDHELELCWTNINKHWSNYFLPSKLIGSFPFRSLQMEEVMDTVMVEVVDMDTHTVEDPLAMVTRTEVERTIINTYLQKDCPFLVPPMLPRHHLNQDMTIIMKTLERRRRNQHLLLRWTWEECFFTFSPTLLDPWLFVPLPV